MHKQHLIIYLIRAVKLPIIKTIFGDVADNFDTKHFRKASISQLLSVRRHSTVNLNSTKKNLNSVGCMNYGKTTRSLQLIAEAVAVWLH